MQGYHGQGSCLRQAAKPSPINGTQSQFSCKKTIPLDMWDVKGNCAKGRSKEALQINRELDNIKAQIIKHYQHLSDREAFVTAEMVRNSYQGFGSEYETLLSAFDKDIANQKKRVGKDRAASTLWAMERSRKDVADFMALKVKAVERLLKFDKESAGKYRYVMKPEMYSSLTQAKVIKEAALRSGVSQGVMKACWDAAGEVIKAWATEGHSVALPGLGSMRFGLRSKAVENVNDVKTSLISSRRIIFTPSVDLKDELANTAIQITCYDRNGNEVKRVTSTSGEVEDPENENTNSTENGGGTNTNPTNGTNEGGGTQNGGGTNTGGDNNGGGGGNNDAPLDEG